MAQVFNGSTLSFTVSFAAPGTIGYNTFKLTDTLQAGLSYVSASAVYSASSTAVTLDTTGSSGTNVTLTFDNPNTNGATTDNTVTIKIIAKVDNKTTLGTPLNNTATVLVNGNSSISTDGTMLPETITAVPTAPTVTGLDSIIEGTTNPAPLNASFPTFDMGGTFDYEIDINPNATYLSNPANDTGFTVTFDSAGTQNVPGVSYNLDTAGTIKVIIANSKDIRNKTIYIHVLGAITGSLSGITSFTNAVSSRISSDSDVQSPVGMTITSTVVQSLASVNKSVAQ